MNKEAFKEFFSSESHPFLLSVSNDDIQDHFTFSFCEKEWHWMYGDVNYPQGLENERTTIIREYHTQVNWRRYPKFNFIFMKGDFQFLYDFSKHLPSIMALNCKVTWHMNDYSEEKHNDLVKLLERLRIMPIDTQIHQVPYYKNIRLGTPYF